MTRVHLMLGLLPRTHHPAIVRSCFVTESASAEPVCEICMPAGACPERHWGRSVKDDAAGVVGSDFSRSGIATTAFRLLAAAAPLFGGSTELAWDPNSRSCPGDAGSRHDACGEDGPSGSGTEVPAAKRMRLVAPSARASPGRGDCVWMLASGRLKRLVLRFDVDGQRLLPSRWCSALAQLVSLRHLHVRLCAARAYKLYRHSQQQSRCDFCMPEFTAALLCLPALEHLALELDNVQPLRQKTSEAAAGHDMQLLDTLSRMPQLSRIILKKWVNLHNRSIMVRAEREVLSQLSHLSCLTSLELHMEHDVSDRQRPSDWGQVFGGALKQLPVLAKLHLELDIHGICKSTRHAEAEELVQELFTAPGLPALSDFHLRMWHEDAPEPPLLIQRLQQCMQSQHEALQARMTALSFASCNWLTAPQHTSEQKSNDAEALAAFVGGLTELQSLMLRNMDLGDHSLEALAGVLPGLAGLTHLDISDTCASSEEVLAVLAALLKPGGPGREGLQSLNISSSCCFMYESEETWRELGRLLRQLHGLTHLEIGALGMEGLRAVVKALAGHAQLRCVRAHENDLSIPELVSEVEAELKKEAAELMPHTEIEFYFTRICDEV